ncbi:zinc finger CCCH domain-containing protein 18 isoform X2 [Cylas formicarius]|uniref:zinc finger CCCH domain-containing protein 18 isoform X2 n=1 Tax=Cylas formicarius TaxID=197179 RepID=UPI00295854FB|nr:zinc finger CCCH domain-containing protein 18 isoform X2 [Cylas formicarius]
MPDMDSGDSSSSSESENKSPSHTWSRSRSSINSQPKSRGSNASRSRSNSPLSSSASPEIARNQAASSKSPDTRSVRSRSSSSEGSMSPHRSPAAQETNNSPKQTLGVQRQSPDISPLKDQSIKSHSNSPGNQTSSPKKFADSDSDDNQSIKSGSSSSKKSQSSRSSRRSQSRSSSRSSSRGSRKSRKKSEDGSTSDSSISSVDSSSRKNKNITKPSDTQAEDVSEGDMESENEKEEPELKKDDLTHRPELNISHEDLSDVSDLEDSLGGNTEDEKEEKTANEIDGGQQKAPDKGDVLKRESSEKKMSHLTGNDTSRQEEGEEPLDFEAEDGECTELDPKEKDKNDDRDNEKKEGGSKKPDKAKEDLEEGEVTDEDDVRPEETEPRPVCRFFSRGQCTWGASCRFLHPGVTDKGNYTMFEMIRPMVPGEFGVGRMMDERLYGKVEPPVVESAWERGLRTAKEMLRKSMKRKEQDIDFEEKKMNLSIAQEEFDKENGYYGRIPSPEPRYVRHIPDYPVARPPAEEYYGRRQVHYEPEYAPPLRREHPRPYREPPVHRGPPPEYYNPKYEEEPAPAPVHVATTARRKTKREVIVQRAPEERQSNRGDEWSDPWMRSKSPSRRRNRKRSYSSGSSSYSSSSSRSSTGTSKSSYRSRSRSLHRGRGSRPRRGRAVSPSVIVSERKAANERAALMNPPAPKRRIPSPGMMRVTGAANPPAPATEDTFGSRRRSKLAVAAALTLVKGQVRKPSRSSSGSSSGSSSESDSSESSSSSSRSASPLPGGKKTSEIVKAMDALKGGALEKNKIKLNLKNPVSVRKPESAETRKLEPVVKKRPANSPPPNDPKSKKATSRREELLKQLKAVEDAIAKKRSKV